MLGGGRIRLNPYGLLLVIILCLVFIPIWYSGSSHSSSLEQGERGLSVSRLLTASILLAERGGQVIRELHEKKKLTAHIKDRAGELVTEADVNSHRTIVYGFKKAFPRLRVISEEHSEEPVSSSELDKLAPMFISPLTQNDFFVANDDVTVWVDPLDATQEFTEGYLEYVSVMVCLAVHGHPLVGVVHMPFSNVTYWGWRGYGQSNSVAQLQQTAERNRKLHIAHGPTILVSRSHSNKLIRSVERSFGRNMSVLRLGGVGYKTLRLIDGTGDIYLHHGAIRKWDVCASDALLAATGGRLSDLNGAKIRYKSSLPHHLEAGLLASASLADHKTYLKRFENEVDKN